MEPEGSLPHLQVWTTCPYPEPDQSSPCPPIALPEDPSSFYPPIYAWVFQVISFPQVSPPPCIHLSSPAYVLHAQEPKLVCIEKVTNTIPGDPNNFTPLPHSLFVSTLANCQMVKKKNRNTNMTFTEHSVWDINVHTTPQPETQNHECSNVNSKLSMDFLMFSLLEVS